MLGKFFTTEHKTKALQLMMLLALFVGSVSVAQFTEPVSSAPVQTESVDAIDTSSTRQVKTGIDPNGEIKTQSLFIDNELCFDSENPTTCAASWSDGTIPRCRVETARVAARTKSTYDAVGLGPAFSPDPGSGSYTCDDVLSATSIADGWLSLNIDHYNRVQNSDPAPPKVCQFARLVCNGLTVAPPIAEGPLVYPTPNLTKSANQCSDFKNNEPSFTKLADANITGGFPAGPAYGADFSVSGNHLAVAHLGSPFVSIYKRTGDTFAKLTPSANPTGTGRRVSFSPDGTFLAVSQDVAPYITIYSISGDTFTKLTAQPNTPPTQTTRGIAFSPDSQYLAIAQNGASPYLHIYKRSGNTFTKLLSPNGPNVQPAGGAYGVDFSPDGTYLAIAHDGASQSTTVYKRTGDQFVALSTPGFTFSQNRGVTFTSDSLKLFVAEVAESGHAYSRVGDTFTHFWSTGSVGSGLFSALTKDDKYLVVGTSNNVAQFYESSTDGGYTLATPPTTLPNTATSQSDFSNDGVYLAMPNIGIPPYIYVYKYSGDGVDYPDDPQCGSWYDNTESSVEQCSDGINNDADAFIDFPADSGCTSASDTTE